MKANKQKTIIHLDMDAYFASIEQRDHPIYRERPLLVCHTDNVDGIRGVIAAASYEARRYGVKAGMSMFEAKKICPNGAFLMGDYNKYLHNTRELIKVCEYLTDQIEVFSIDEMWLDITKTKHLFGDDVGRIACLLQEKVRRHLGLSVSIGVGPNKLVAKMAGEFHKPGGITVIRPQDLPRILAPLSVDKLFGVGKKMKKHFLAAGITTIGHLAETPETYLRKKFGVVGLYLKAAALGLDDTIVVSSRNPVPLTVKSFGHSAALGGGEADMDKLSQILLGLCEGVTRRMRRDQCLGRTITLRLCPARLFNITRSRTIFQAVDLTEKIYPIARDLLLKEAPVLIEYPATLIGVSVTGLIHNKRQLSIFDLMDEPIVRLTVAVDQIKNKYGEKIITKASLLNWKRRY